MENKYKKTKERKDISERQMIWKRWEREIQRESKKGRREERERKRERKEERRNDGRRRQGEKREGGRENLYSIIHTTEICLE